MKKQFATFYLGTMAFGIDVLLVREVNALTDFTPVDPAPNFLAGLLNLRGQIVSLVDLSVRLDLKRKEGQTALWCFVLKTMQELQAGANAGTVDDITTHDVTGFLVEGVGDIVSVEPCEIEPPPPNLHGIEGRYLSGVAKLEQQLVALLSVGAIVRDMSEKKEST